MGVKVNNLYFEQVATQQQVFSSVLAKPFPAKAGYWIARAVEKVQSESRAYFTAKQNILKNYAETDENGNLKVDKDGLAIWKAEAVREKAMEEINEIQRIEVDLGIEPVEVDFDELERRGVTLSPLEVALLPFLKPRTE